MRKLLIFGAALALATGAAAAPNVSNATQKGSLLVFPDIVAGGTRLIRSEYPAGVLPAAAEKLETLVRIQNDGNSQVDVKCYWMDGNKNRVDFQFMLTRNQAFWFDATTGAGSTQVNPFPTGAANGLDGTEYPYGNPYLPNPLLGGGVRTTNPAQGATTEGAWNANSSLRDPAYRKGLLACWAVDAGGQNQVKWNHLSGTATVYSVSGVSGAYEYNAYAFFVPTGVDLQPVGAAGTLQLDGVQYDACPLYQIGQFSPGTVAQLPLGALPLWANNLAITGCHLELQQDWTPYWTKLHFDVWNEDEVKFTGAYECADSWHETDFFVGDSVGHGGLTGPTVWDGRFGSTQAHQPFNNGLDAGAQAFLATTLGTYSARYRVQALGSSQCPNSRATGVLAVQSTYILNVGNSFVGTTLAGAGKASGRVVWDPAGAVPEGGIR